MEKYIFLYKKFPQEQPFQNNTFLHVFLFFGRVIFAHLDLDPVDQNQRGSRSTILFCWIAKNDLNLIGFFSKFWWNRQIFNSIIVLGELCLFIMCLFLLHVSSYYDFFPYAYAKISLATVFYFPKLKTQKMTVRSLTWCSRSLYIRTYFGCLGCTDKK